MQHATGLPFFFEGYAYHPLLIYFFLPFYWLFTLMAGSSPVFIGGHFPSLPVLIYPWAPFAILMLKIPIIIADVAIVYVLAGSEPQEGGGLRILPLHHIHLSGLGNVRCYCSEYFFSSHISRSPKTRMSLSGFTYGLSLMKLYTIVLLPLFIIRLFGRWRELGEFLLGLSITLVPVAYYLMVSPAAFWNVLVVFQGTRVMGGVNMYNFIWIVPDVRFDLQLSTIPSILLVVGLVYVLLRFGRTLPLLEANACGHVHEFPFWESYE